MERIATILSSETATVIKTSAPVQTWTKPELVQLGELKDVAGNNAINNLIAVPSAPKRPVREKGVLVTGKRREPCPTETVMAQAALDWMSSKRQRLVSETRDQGTDP